jgi:hypothetical protein
MISQSLGKEKRRRRNSSNNTGLFDHNHGLALLHPYESAWILPIEF